MLLGVLGLERALQDLLLGRREAVPGLRRRWETGTTGCCGERRAKGIGIVGRFTLLF